MGPPMEPWPPEEAPRAARGDRRPLGVTVAALFYIVLGSHALMVGAYLLGLSPAEASPALGGLVRDDPGFVRSYALALLGIALAFFVLGVGLFRRWAWVPWAVLLAVPLHVVGPPFQMGGVLFAALVNVYLFGTGAYAWLTAPPPPSAGGAVPQA